MSLSIIVGKKNKLNILKGTPLIKAEKINKPAANELFHFIDIMLAKKRVEERYSTRHAGLTSHLTESVSSLTGMGFSVPVNCNNITTNVSAA